eukprot:gene11041-19890_t
MHEKSIKRHCRDIHGEEEPSSECVDEAACLFLVRTSSKGDVSFPVHIRENLMTQDGQFGVGCEDKSSTDLLRTGKIVVAECKHIKDAMKNPVQIRSIHLSHWGWVFQYELENPVALGKEGEHRLLNSPTARFHNLPLVRAEPLHQRKITYTLVFIGSFIKSLLQ